MEAVVGMPWAFTGRMYAAIHCTVCAQQLQQDGLLVQMPCAHSSDQWMGVAGSLRWCGSGTAEVSLFVRLHSPQAWHDSQAITELLTNGWGSISAILLLLSHPTHTVCFMVHGHAC